MDHVCSGLNKKALQDRLCIPFRPRFGSLCPTRAIVRIGWKCISFLLGLQLEKKSSKNDSNYDVRFGTKLSKWSTSSLPIMTSWPGTMGLKTISTRLILILSNSLAGNMVRKGIRKWGDGAIITRAGKLGCLACCRKYEPLWLPVHFQLSNWVMLYQSVNKQLFPLITFKANYLNTQSLQDHYLQYLSTKNLRHVRPGSCCPLNSPHLPTLRLPNSRTE